MLSEYDVTVIDGGSQLVVRVSAFSIWDAMVVAEDGRPFACAVRAREVAL